MGKDLDFKIKNESYYINRYLFQNDKKTAKFNINEVNTEKIVLSDKTTYGKHGANKCYIRYLNGGF